MSTTDIRYRISLDPGNASAAAGQVAGAVAQIGRTGQASAGQVAAAMQSLPAQFIDVATQLQGGQNPLTILMQQGGQVVTQFGGMRAAIGGAASYLAGMITPATAAAGALVAVGAAFMMGRDEAENFRAVLIKSGNAAGLTSERMTVMAASVRAAGVATQGAASDVISQLAATGKVSADVMARATTGIAGYAKVSGEATKDLVANMAALGAEPVRALEKLNGQYNFLSAATYAQVSTLQAQGRTAEAAAVAQTAYADMMIQRTAALRDNLGLVELAAGGVASAAKAMWDGLLDIGRESGFEEKMQRAQAKLLQAQTFQKNSFAPGWYQSSVDDARDEITQLVRRSASERDAANRQAADNAAIGAQRYLQALRGQFDVSTRLNTAVAEYLRNVQALQLVGIKVSEMEQARDLAAIRRANVDQQELANREAGITQQMAMDRSAAEARLRAADQEDRALAVRKAKGLLSLQEQAAEEQRIGEARLRARIAIIDAQIKAEADRQPQDEAGRTGQQTALIGLRSQRADLVGQLNGLPLVTQAAAEAQALQQSRQAAQQWAQAWAQADQLVNQLADQSAAGAAALITDPLQRARAEADIAVAQIERNTQRLTASIRAQVDTLRASGQGGMADALQAKLDEIDKAKVAAQQGARDKAGAGLVQDYLRGDIGVDLAAGFDKASQSLGALTQNFGKLVDEQVRYGQAKQKAAGNASELEQIEARHARLQLNSYAALTGAAKGFFDEKTAGYKILQATEQAFRVAEIAAAVAATSTKLGLEGGYTVASLALSGVRTAGLAVEALVSSMVGLPFPLNLAAFGATAAVIAGLGVSMRGGGGGSSALPAANDGSGTVLGDKSAKSDSLAKSLEQLRQVDLQTMRYSSQMAASLANIEGSIGAMAALLVRSGAIESSAAGIQVGTSKNWWNSTTAGITTATLDVMTLGLTRSLNQRIGNILGNLFGSTKTEITGQGIQAGPQSVASILGSGFAASYYNDIKTTSSSLFGLSKSTSNSTQLTNADGEFTRQVATLVGNYASTIQAAAGPLGRSLSAVSQQVSGFVVNIGRIDTKGLSGSALQERLSAVFSRLGDQLASAALGGLEDFQRVGEGYLATVVRVASGTEQAQSALRRLGVTAVALSALTDKQADVAVQQVRQSLLAIEGAASGIGQIVAGISTSVDDLTSAYRSLTGVRSTLKLLGLDGNAVGFGLIDGAGGLQQLTDGLQAFQTGLLTTTQQVQVKSSLLAQDFAKLGLAMPRTGAQFVSLVKGIDTSTAAGQQLLGGVLGLTSGFTDLLDAISGLGQGIQSEIDRIKGTQAVSGTFAELQTKFALSTAQARAGDAAAIDRLPQLSQALLAAAQDSTSTAGEFASIQYRTLDSLQQTLAMISSTDTYTVGAGQSVLAQKADQTNTTLESVRRDLVAAINNQGQSIDALTALLRSASNVLTSVIDPTTAVNVKVIS